MDKLKRAVIKEEYVALTGDYRAAIILNQFIYWSERVRDFDKFVEEENERISKFSPEDTKFDGTNGWIYKTADDLITECMLVTLVKNEKTGNISKTTLLSYIDLLLENHWLEKRKNPKYKWDRTLQYRVNLLKIAYDLHKIGYTLQEYKLPDEFYYRIKELNIDIPILDSRCSENENQSPKSENQSPKIEHQSPKTGQQYHRLQSETTLKNTTDKGKRQDNFNNFEQRDYDYEDLEKRLLGWK